MIWCRGIAERVHVENADYEFQKEGGHRGEDGSPVTSFYYCLTRGRQHYPRCKLIVAPCTSACASCDLIVTDCLFPRVTKLRLAVNVGPLSLIHI